MSNAALVLKRTPPGGILHLLGLIGFELRLSDVTATGPSTTCNASCSSHDDCISYMPLYHGVVSDQHALHVQFLPFVVCQHGHFTALGYGDM